MSDEQDRKPFFGKRLGSVQPESQPARQPKTGERFFFHRPDGTINKPQILESEDKEMKIDPERSKETLRMIQGGDFEYRVMKLREQNVPLAEAIAKVASEFPEKHEDYLRRAQIGQADPLK